MGGGMPPGGGIGGMFGSNGGRANGGRGGGPLIIPKGGGGGLRSGGGPRNTGDWGGAGAGEGLRNRTACCAILVQKQSVVNDILPNSTNKNKLMVSRYFKSINMHVCSKATIVRYNTELKSSRKKTMFV